MKVLLGKRRSGRTTELIKKSAVDRFYIVCHSQKECSRVFEEAKKMKLSIPFPITFDELRKKLTGPGVRGVHIDNADLLLEQLAGVEIGTVVFEDME